MARARQCVARVRRRVRSVVVLRLIRLVQEADFLQGLSSGARSTGIIVAPLSGMNLSRSSRTFMLATRNAAIVAAGIALLVSTAGAESPGRKKPKKRATPTVSAAAKKTV